MRTEKDLGEIRPREFNDFKKIGGFIMRLGKKSKYVDVL